MKKTITGKSGKVYTFTYLSDDTQLARKWCDMALYFEYDGNTLSSIYKSWSDKKEHAYNNCLKKAIDLNSDTKGVLCWNCNTFTYGYVFPDPETGELFLGIETHRNSYLMRW